MTLYNTYRPQTFDDVIGQKHVVDTLRGAISKNRIGHAYLFTGPRGTGKTTLARIFAHGVNCMPRDGFEVCSDDICAEILAGNSLDIMEIDAASNTSVDYIRQLREKIATAPTRTHYKVYIIDEVHMLSTGAFNALLKTLEEPPEHTIFIFATTEAHKLPATILSRVQRFDLTRLSTTHIAQKITMIVTAEGYTISNAAAHIIALAAGGAMRDAESLLAQVFSFISNTTEITTDDVRSILGTTRRTENFSFIDALISADAPNGLRIVTELVDRGIDLRIFTTTTLAILRHMLLICADQSQQSLISEFYDDDENTKLTTIASKVDLARLATITDALMKTYARIGTSIIPQLPLEILVIELTTQNTEPICAQPQSANPTQIAQSPVSKNTSKSTPKNQTKETSEATRDNQTITNSNKKQTPSKIGSAPSRLANIVRKWPQIITAIKANNSPLSAVVSQCTPHTLENDTLTILSPNKLFKAQITKPENQLTILKALATIDNIDEIKNINITLEPDKPSSSLIANTANTMGGGKIVG